MTCPDVVRTMGRRPLAEEVTVSEAGKDDWWQASNGHWYPPAAHPSNQPQAAAGAVVPPGAPPANPAAAPPGLAALSDGLPSPYPPGAPGAPPADHKNRRTLWIVLGSVVASVLIIVGAIVGSTSHSTSGSGTPAGHLGQIVHDGDFAFKVVTVTCGVTHVGSSYIGTTAPAGSQWCVAGIVVGNNSTSAQLFSASDQKAIDTAGQELSADTGAMIFLSTDKVLTTLNPGVAVAVRIAFELSKSSRITSFELHDSAFSDGVTVENKT